MQIIYEYQSENFRSRMVNMKTKLTILSIILVFVLMQSCVAFADVTTVYHDETQGDYVYVAGNPDFYPVEYYNSDTMSFEGIMPSVLNAISQKIGIDFAYIYHPGADQSTLASNTQTELVSALNTDLPYDYAIDKVTLFTYSHAGSDTNIGFVFTKAADASLVSAIKSEAAKISQTDINGYFINSTNQASKDSPNILLVTLFCALLVAVTVISIVKLRSVENKCTKNRVTDHVTGIGNLAYFENRFTNDISDFSRSLYYVMYIIIDSNYIEVYHGNSAFYDVVKYTAYVLSTYAKHYDITARITDNGFAYAYQSPNITEAKTIANEIIQKLNAYVAADDQNSRPVFHAAVYNLDISDRNCEFVLFNLRRNCIKIFETDNQLVFCDEKCMNSVRREQEIIERINIGFSKNEFKLYLQFIVDNKTKKIVSAEALSRWDNPDKGLLTPGKYIDIMSATGLITKHDFYMFELVCAQLEKWQKTSEFKHISISCNFTRITLSEDDFAEKIKTIADKYTFDRSKLSIEITEDAIERDMKKAMSNINKCRQYGFTIALDDLGSGYTSLSNLCDYTIDVVKIDRDILLKTDTQKGKELFEGIIALSHSLNLRVVCEGVETAKQNEFVTASDCDYVQGWHYSKALPIDECEGFVRSYSARCALNA